MIKLIRTLLELGLFAAAVLVAFRSLPPEFHNYQFQDAMIEESRLSGPTTRTEDEIRDRIYDRALEFQIPVRRDEIHVQRSERDILIWTDYNVHVNVPVHPFQLEFHPHTPNLTGKQQS
jgi:hypothetical protein